MEQKPEARVRPQTSLLAWRTAKGFNQHEAAVFLGISQAYYCKLERGDQTPRPKIARRLMDRTGVPLEELLGIAS